MHIMRKLLLFILVASFAYSECGDINSNADEPLRLVNYVCLDIEQNITDMATQGNYLYVSDINETNDTNPMITLSIFQMSKVNYPVANSITATLLDDINFTQGEFDVTNIVGAGTRILVGGGTGVRLYNYSGGTISLIDANDTNMVMNEATLYSKNNQSFAFIADNDKLKIINMNSASSTSLTLGQGVIGNYLGFDYNIAGLYAYRDSLYVASLNTDDDLLTIDRFQIILENNAVVLERRETFSGDSFEADTLAQEVELYANGDYLFITMDANNTETKDANVTTFKLNKLHSGTFEANVSDATDFSEKENNSSFTIGDNFYRVEVGPFGLSVFERNVSSTIATDDSFQGHKMLSVGEHIIVNDHAGYIRMYKYGRIAASTTRGDAPLEVTFSVQKFNLETLFWDFDDGTALRYFEQNATHTYTVAGNYEPRATIRYKDDIVNASGSLDNIFTIDIETTGNNTPQVQIIANGINGQVPFVVTFDANISYNGFINNIVWDLGDGNHSTASSLTHTYNDPEQVYAVTLTVFYGAGLSVSDAVTIETLRGGGIEIAYPVGSDIASIGDLINFSYTLPEGVDEVNVSSVVWSFGDGGMSNVADSRYSYAREGTYNVTLQIIDINSTVYTLQETLVVYSDSIHFIRASPTIGESPLQVVYNIETTTNLQGVPYIRSATCFLPNGTVSYTDSFSATYATEGSHQVRCNIILSDNTQKTLTRTVEVDNELTLTPSISTASGESPLSVSFSAAYSSHSGLKSLVWDFGTGTTATTASTTYIYKNAGVFNGSVTMTTNKNHTLTKQFSVTVTDPPISDVEENTTVVSEQASVTIYATKLSNDYTYRFEAIISNYTSDISSYWWEFQSNIRSYVGKTTADYSFASLSTYTVTFKIQYKDSSISTHNYTFTADTNDIKLVLNSGWNLISAPVDVAFELLNSNTVPPIGTLSMSTIRNNYVNSILTFNNNAWARDPSYIARRAGIWVQSLINNNTLTFSGGTPYTPVVATLARNQWHLVGTGSDLTNFLGANSTYISRVFTYDTFYSEDPYLIRRGQGIWVLTRP